MLRFCYILCAATQAAAPPTDYDAVTTAILYIFSWVMLFPIAVIASGYFLDHFLKLDVDPENRFGIQIPFLHVAARGSAVIFGFTAYILTVMLLAFLLGPDRAVDIMSQRFGITQSDRFTALCLLSSLWALVGSFLCYLVCCVIRGAQASRPANVLSSERDAIIKELRERRAQEHADE